MLVYPVVFERDGPGYFVRFPDFPEALTSASTKREAREMARDALETAIEFYFEDRRTVPMPGRMLPGQDAVELPASLSAKILLLNEMILQDVSPSELARRMEVSPQTVQRVIDLGHATKIDTIAEAFRVLGRRLDFQIRKFAKAA
jgi:antitoxin HicB